MGFKEGVFKMNIYDYQIKALLVIMFVYIIIKFIIRRTVSIYNKDFNGKHRYLGWAFIVAKYDVYEIRFSNKICDNALTNEYIIVTKEFILGRKYYNKVVIRAGNHARYVDFDDQMEVVF